LRYFPDRIDTLYEPFAGSAAVSLACAANRVSVRKFHINDLNQPLIRLWHSIVNAPETLARDYQLLWNAQLAEPARFYREIRDKFNKTGRPDYFLYLLARCVKASVRYNSEGEFNQSPDNRRMGATPATMRKHLTTASLLLKHKTVFSSKDYRDIVALADVNDLVYMDPPYQGVCGNRDSRYLSNIQFKEFVELLKSLNAGNIRYIVSYDGRTGEKIHGQALPASLRLERIELNAGRSTQATLLGRKEDTYESLYLSPALSADLSMRNSSAVFREQPIFWSIHGQATVA